MACLGQWPVKCTFVVSGLIKRSKTTGVARMNYDEGPGCEKLMTNKKQNALQLQHVDITCKQLVLIV